MLTTHKTDVAIVGAGIVGLAHAYAFAKRGHSVVVFERNPCAIGASIRNFGMIWPIGQIPGRWHRTAMQSRALWLEALTSAGLWHEEVGSLHVAYRDDEWQVLREFADRAPSLGFTGTLVSSEEARRRSPFLRTEQLRGAFWSATEVCVDPRAAIAGLPTWLREKFGVRFQFDTAVTAVEDGVLLAGGARWETGRTVVCGGDDFQTLFPEVFVNSGIVRCKLQMMRSAPLSDGARIGPMLAAGLTLCHYPSFRECPGLPALKERIARELPDHVRYGIHVMAAQNGLGEITIGDSHEYGQSIDIVDKAEIDALVLSYLRSFLDVPGLTISQHWHGVYAKHPHDQVFRTKPRPTVDVVVVTTGVGMTLSFGLGEETAAGTSTATALSAIGGVA